MKESKIEKITFVDFNKVPEKVIYSYDASLNKDSSVMAWYIDSDKNGNHELYFLKGTEIDDEMGEGEIKHQNWVKSQITSAQKEYLENCTMHIEKIINNKKILYVHFPIDYNSKDDYPFRDLKIAKDGSIKNVIESLDYDLIFIGHEHNSFCIDNKLYDVGSSGCTKNNTTIYTILDTNTFNIERKNIQYNRRQFEEELLKNNYPERDLIAKWFFGIEV